jgi:hypothetical protein
MLSDAVILALIGAGTGILALGLKLWRSSSCKILYCCGGSPFHIIFCQRDTDHEKDIVINNDTNSPRRLQRQNSISNINVI